MSSAFGSVFSPRCKRVLALLTPEPHWEEELCAALESAFGPIDFRGAFLPFADTEYYTEEMGAPLYRGWVSFRGLAAPEHLAQWKEQTRALEARWTRDGKRSRNLDIGYLDPDKLVLASYKRGPFKLYLGNAVWADMVMGYARGCYTSTPWAFADFRSGQYNKVLGAIREKLKAEMRVWNREHV